MDNKNFDSIKAKPVFRTILFFLIILCVAVILILLGRRNDAVTKAQIYHAGVLTADKVNTAFDKVSGTLVARHVNESDQVKKGDLLLEIDDRDLHFTIDNLQAQLDGLDAQIRQQDSEIKLDLDRLKTEEEGKWYQIEQLDASLQGAIALSEQAKAEYERYSSLKESSSVSKSAYDSAKRTYLQAESSRLSILKNLQEMTLGATTEQIEKL
ncbi:MAG: biotin/lipoyl-binding protein, partial [Succinivibrio sp.]|nr:biotin/lipoyl-binding protein [Succinivibrio sp.]